MNTTDTKPTAGAKKSLETKRDPYLSKDGKWRKVPKVPCLLQYVASGAYFGKLKVNGKQIRQSLQTTSLTVAKAKLPDFIKKHQRQRAVAGTMAEARQRYLDQLDADHVLSAQTKKYYQDCIAVLFKTWPDLDRRDVASIKTEECQDWAKRFSADHDEQYFNNTLSRLRLLFELAGYAKADSPAHSVKRLGMKPTELHLPDLSQFGRIVEEVGTAGSRHSKHCATLVRFLAFSGCRISEARGVTWADVDLDRGTLRVRNAKTRKQTSGHTHRTVPIIPQLRDLLVKLKADGAQPDAPVLVVGECEKSLTNACKRVGVERLTHHDLRHFFATRCIESGVDVPTVSRWLGHSDGGALAMRTYGHLRNEHSVAMAQKVSFSTEAKNA